MKILISLVVLIIVVSAGFYLFPKDEIVIENLNKEDVIEQAEAKVFNLTGKDYSFSTTEIRVQEGDTVTINFESTQGFHDWVINEFEVGTERVVEGDSSSVTFVVDKKGEFEFYCSVGDHRAKGMVGKLIVE